MLLRTGSFVCGMSEFQDLQEDAKKGSGSRIIGRILPAAVRFWLRSQLESINQLDIQLEGRDRQIISGRLPKVTVIAENAVYKGIHLSSAQLSAEDIRVNIGQVVRGKPLRLLKAFPVLGEISLTAIDLNASLKSGLLREGLKEFWQSLVRAPALAKEIRARYGQLPLETGVMLQEPQVALSDRRVGLSFYPGTQSETASVPIILGLEITVVSGHLFRILSARWLSQLSEITDPSLGSVIPSLENFEWDLGADTQISQLVVQPEKLLCSGQLQVNP